MSYSDARLLKDADGRPIPQMYDPVTETFTPLIGREGSSRVELYGVTGEPVGIETALALLATAAKQDAAKAVLDLLATEVTVAALLAELESQHYDTSEPQNVTLTPSQATELTFAAECAYFDIFNEGPGDAWVKVDGTATIAGAGCLKVPEDIGYSLRQRGTTVSLIGASASVVQVVGVR